ncbi:MAG TPA: fibronectin type III domain-containing protein, partial [Acidimicrobiales bacterium]|nr:fibronectin type III domain-containing protein [Acidimicrobiales bacterium]
MGALRVAGRIRRKIGFALGVVMALAGLPILGLISNLATAPAAGAVLPPGWNYVQGAVALDAVACAPGTPADCWAGGSQITASGVAEGIIEVTTNQGATGWSLDTLPAGTGQIVGISCFSSTVCYAVESGVSGHFLVLGGTSWSDGAGAFPPGVDSPTSLSCTTATDCWVSATDTGTNLPTVIATSNGGGAWSAAEDAPAGTASLNSVSCSGVTCFAAGVNAGGAVVIANGGGASWSDTAGSLAPMITESSISCASTTACWVAGVVGGVQQVDNTANGGGAWSPALTEPPVPAVGSGSINSISCVAASTDCFAVGQDLISNAGPIPYGDVYSTTNGTSWSAQTFPASATSMSDISCVDANDCMAVGSTYTLNTIAPSALSTSDAGVVWSTAVGTGASEIAPGVSSIGCPSSSVCFGVGSGWGAQTTSNGGTTWSTQSFGTQVGWLNSVSCASTSDCWAVGATSPAAPAGAIMTTSGACGSAWCSEAVPAGVTDLMSVTCPSTTVCYATGIAGVSASIIGTTNGGTTWTAQTIPAGATTISAVSCPSTSACYATGVVGGVTQVFDTTNSGGTWSSVAGTLPADAASLTSISCPTTSVCLAGGENPSGSPTVAATTNSGASWTPEYVPASVAGSINSIICVSSIQCSATESGAITAQVFSTFDGAAWFAQTVPAKAAVLSSAQCASATSCFVAGPSGILATADSGETIPAAPTGVGGQAGNGEATFWWIPPASGGAPVTNYSLSVSPACGSCTGLGSIAGSAISTTVNGLTNGTAYTLSLTATNAAGTGVLGTSAAVTPAAPVLTQTPTWSSSLANESLSGVTCASATECISVGQL